MSASLEFILSILDRDEPPRVAWEDFTSAHGPALRLWQRLSFLARESERNPVPSCPYCCEGSPYLIGGRYLCPECHSAVDERHLLLWRFDLNAFLAWLARTMKLTGGVRQIDRSLWQVGTLSRDGLAHECFFRRGVPLSEVGRHRLLAYRNAVLLRGPPRAESVDGFHGPCLSLVELIRQDEQSLTVRDIERLLHAGGTVRFDPASGALFAGNTFLGEVPVASKEYHLMSRLWQEFDQFVPYADLKQHVLQQASSTDSADEATFCHKLKGRIKGRGCVPKIDALIATTKKGDGYRLRRYVPGMS